MDTTWHPYLSIARDKTPIFAKSSLKIIATSHTLRCDAKIAERRFRELEQMLSSVECFYLGDYLPSPFVKGRQPRYLEVLDPSGVPVINTLSIQNLTINLETCRFITEDAFERLPEEVKLKQGDVLLTMDGGTSIGKPALFNLDVDCTVDTHVAILRPSGLSPRALVYLLASPLGQLQFQRAESGASGQTAVTEEDVRRFRFPRIAPERLVDLVDKLDKTRQNIAEERQSLFEKESRAWGRFYTGMIEG